MATSPTQIRIDENTKQQAVTLLEGLGLNLSDAVNMFLKQVILQNGIPFEVKYPEFKPEVIAAMEEAKALKELCGRYQVPVIINDRPEDPECGGYGTGGGVSVGEMALCGALQGRTSDQRCR